MELEGIILEYCMDKGQVLFYPFYSLPYIVPAAPDEGAASGAAIFDWDLCRGLPVQSGNPWGWYFFLLPFPTLCNISCVAYFNIT